jgi:hypothetical protein
VTAKENASSTTAAKKRPTVASLATELDAVRAELATLKDIVAGLTAAGAAVAVGGSTAGVARAARALDSAGASTAVKTPPDTKEDPMAPVHAILRQVFTLAQEALPVDEEERDEQFARFKKFVHSDRKGTGVLDQSLRNYTWAQLRSKVNIYLDDPDDVGSYTVTRMTPDAVGRQTLRVKLFLKARTRMPTPITLRRDDADSDNWRVEASSL